MLVRSRRGTFVSCIMVEGVLSLEVLNRFIGSPGVTFGRNWVNPVSERWIMSPSSSIGDTSLNIESTCYLVYQPLNYVYFISKEDHLAFSVICKNG